MRIGFFVIYLLFFFNVSALAQRKTKIYGVIQDERGNPIELAFIRILGTSHISTSDFRGRYVIYAAPKDSVWLQFSQIGYQKRKRLLHNLADSLQLNIVLPDYDQSFSTAVVRGQRKQATMAQHIKKTDDFSVPSTTGNGIEDIISMQAGVSSHNELSSQYNVRGGAYDENVVYLNGIELYRPFLVHSGQQEGLSVINPDMVSSIVFSSGGFDAHYGDKMSSVLDIAYKRPQKFNAKLNFGMLGGGVYAGWGNKKFSIMASVRKKTTKYLLTSLDTHGEYNPDYLDAQTYVSYHPNVNWNIDCILNLSRNNYSFRPHDRETSFGTLNNLKKFKVYFDGQEKDHFNTNFGNISITHRFSDKTFLSLQFSSFMTNEAETYDIQGQYWLNEATHIQQIGVGTYMEHARNFLKADVQNVGIRFKTEFKSHTPYCGINYKLEKIYDYSSEWEMRDSMGYSLPYSQKELSLIFSLHSHNHIQTKRFESFVMDSWRVHNALGLFNMTYGVRLNYWNWNEQLLISPRISVGLLPSSFHHWVFRLASGVYYQAPFYKELRDTINQDGESTILLNRKIKAQKSIHFVAGADYTFALFNRPFKFTAEAYYKLLSDLNPYTIDNLKIVYRGKNIAKGYATGVDLKLFGEFVAGVDSWLTFSLMKTAEIYDGVSAPLPTDQRYNVSLFFTDYFPGSTRWKATLKLAYADGLPFYAPRLTHQSKVFRAPAYRRVDLGVSYRILKSENFERRRYGKLPVKNMYIGFDLFNLLGIRNVNSYYWVTDITNTKYAVPNYLTGRRLNIHFGIEF